MSEEQTALQTVIEFALERGLGPAWEKLGPLSAGAVVSSVVIVGAGSLLRRALGSRYGRALGWLSAAALLPLGVWLLAEVTKEENPERGSGDARAERLDEDGRAELLETPEV
jgi:hypothetical protein